MRQELRSIGMFAGQWAGFSLAEILIAIAVLGVIATFTIPKVLTQQQSQRVNAVLKEDVATISAIVQQGVQNNAITPANAVTYIFNNLNAIKLCPNNGYTEGCRTANIWNWGNTSPVAVMANGSQIVVSPFGGYIERANVIEIGLDGHPETDNYSVNSAYVISMCANVGSGLSASGQPPGKVYGCPWQYYVYTNGYNQLFN